MDTPCAVHASCQHTVGFGLASLIDETLVSGRNIPCTGILVSTCMHSRMQYTRGKGLRTHRLDENLSQDINATRGGLDARERVNKVSCLKCADALQICMLHAAPFVSFYF
jgi:hypothetical protein